MNRYRKSRKSHISLLHQGWSLLWFVKQQFGKFLLLQPGWSCEDSVWIGKQQFGIFLQPLYPDGGVRIRYESGNSCSEDFHSHNPDGGVRTRYESGNSSFEDFYSHYTRMVGWGLDMNREAAVRKISIATTRMVAGINQAVLSGRDDTHWLYEPFDH